MRIVVNIDRGKVSEATQFLRARYPKYQDLLYIQEQSHRPRSLATLDPAGVYSQVASGSVVVHCQPTVAHNISNRRDVTLAAITNGMTSSTIACFVKDRNHNYYAVSLQHTITGDKLLDFNTKTDNTLPKFHSVSAKRETGPDLMTRSVLLSKDVIGQYNRVKIDGKTWVVDIALLPLSKNSLKNVRLHVKNRGNGPLDLKVNKLGSGNNQDDGLRIGAHVFKRGAETNYTQGEVTDFYVADAVNQQSSFLVTPRQQDSFSAFGDCGSLVIADYGPQMVKSLALGIIHKRQQEYFDSDDQRALEVTFCLPLEHCFKALKQTFDIDLTLCDSHERPFDRIRGLQMTTPCTVIIVLLAVIVLLVALMWPFPL